MPSFSLFYFDDFTLVGGEWIDAANKEQAVLVGLRQARGHAFELWDAAGRVRSFPRADRREPIGEVEPARTSAEALMPVCGRRC